MQIELFINKCLQAISREISLQAIFSVHSKITRKIQIEDNKSETYKVDIYRAQGGRMRIEKYDQEQKKMVVMNCFRNKTILLISSCNQTFCCMCCGRLCLK